MYPTETFHICDTCLTVVSFGTETPDNVTPITRKLSAEEYATIDLTAPDNTTCQSCHQQPATATITLHN